MRIVFYAQDATGEWRHSGARDLVEGEIPNLRSEAADRLAKTCTREDSYRGRQVRADVPDTVTVQARLMSGSRQIDSDEAHR